MTDLRLGLEHSQMYKSLKILPEWEHVLFLQPASTMVTVNTSHHRPICHLYHSIYIQILLTLGLQHHEHCLRKILLFHLHHNRKDLWSWQSFASQSSDSRFQLQQLKSLKLQIIVSNENPTFPETYLVFFLSQALVTGRNN